MDESNETAIRIEVFEELNSTAPATFTIEGRSATQMFGISVVNPEVFNSLLSAAQFVMKADGRLFYKVNVLDIAERTVLALTIYYVACPIETLLNTDRKYLLHILTGKGSVNTYLALSQPDDFSSDFAQIIAKLGIVPIVALDQVISSYIESL